MLLHYLISHNISTVFFEGDYEIRIGFIIFALFYLLVVLRSVKKAEKMQELLTSKEDIKKNKIAKYPAFIFFKCTLVYRFL